MSYMREHRKTTAANLPSDCTHVGTGQLQAKNQQEAKGKIEFRNTKAGVLQVLFGMLQLVDSLYCQNSIIKSKNKEKNLAISENVHTFAPHLRTMLGKTETSHLKEGWVSG